jgi:hypothetical protein
MTISSLLNRIAFNCNGATTAFPITYPFFAQADLVVLEVTIATGLQAIKILNSDYTISGTTDAAGHYPNGGTVNATVAPPSTVQWVVYRDPAVLQGVSLTEGGALPVKASIESPLDLLTMLEQRSRDLVSRSLTQPDGDVVNLNKLPAKVSRASLFLGFDVNGQPIATLPVNGTISSTTPVTVTGTPTARALGDRFLSTLSVKDFGAVGDGITDDTNAIQTAINFLTSGGNILVPAASYKITSTLIIPGLVYLVGQGSGSIQAPISAPATVFLWYGSAVEMVKVGWQASTVNGGGLIGIRLDGRAACTKCLSIKDHQRGTFRDVLLMGSSTDALYFTNTAGQTPTGFSIFDDLKIQLRGNGTDSSNGIHFDGVGSGTDGVTFCQFRKTRIEHANGDAIRIELRGDAMLWEDLYTFRANSETGSSVHAASIQITAVLSNWTFIRPLLNSSIQLDGANVASGWTIIGADNVDVSSGYATFANGPGSSDIHLLSSTTGRRQGRDVTNGYRETIDHDSMTFMRWDSANNLLFTSRGAYLTGGTYATANILDAGQPGGAVAVTGGTTTGNILYFTETPALGTTGVVGTYAPQMVVAWTPTTITNVVARVGYIGDTTDPPNNGVYIEAAPATNANYRCVCRKAGVETAIVTTVAIAIAKIQWRIEWDPTFARFFYRTLGNEGWALAGVTLTNIPTTIVSPMFWIKTLENAGKTMHIYDLKKGFTTEV